MENSTSKLTIKPLFLKAGIPLALSIAGFVSAKIIAKRISRTSCFESKISSDEELTKLQNHFLEYQEMKEKELMLVEVKNRLELEAARVEFLDREISSMEAENGRFFNLVDEYLRLLERVKLENEMLKRKMKKMLKNAKEKSRIIREKTMKMDATEEEVLRLCNEVEVRCNEIKTLENRVEELERFVNSLQEDNNEILMKLKAFENSAPSNRKIDAEWVTKEEYNAVAKKLEKLREERATEIAEIMYLKWNNAGSLKHEVLRNHEQIEENRDRMELGQLINADRGSHRTQHEHHSKRKKILKKIKKWVEGNDHIEPKLEEKENQEVKCFGRLSIYEEDGIVQPRRSCSSA